jgi:BASS family bile acid:Na+ symporter
MPLLAYALGTFFGLQGDAFVGIVMVGCVPGAMASNVLTLNARGNTSYSVSLTTMATLLSPLAVPTALGLALAAEKSVSIDFVKTSLTLLVTVVIPVIAGHLSSRRAPSWQRHARQWGTLVANLTILWIIAAVVGRSRGQLAQFRFDVLWALLAVNLCGYLAGYGGGWALRLPDRMRRALTLEVGMQNAGLGASLATQLFPDRKAVAIAPAMYTFGCMLTGTILARAWAVYFKHMKGEADSPQDGHQ